MKKVLIISELFFPSNQIGAIRPTKIAKKLHNLGYAVDVLTRYGVENSSDICDNLFSFDTLKCDTASTSATRKDHGKFYNKLYGLVYPFRTLLKAKNMQKKFMKALSENNELGETKYDAVISSFGPLSSLLCGLYYKRSHPETKWICDFRDPVIVKYIPKIWRPIFRRFEVKACNSADAIVAVSNGYLERICRGKYAEKAFMIPNGYDIDDSIFDKTTKISDGRMKIAYVGSLYGGDRDLSPLFRVIYELIQEGSIDKENVCVSYAGNEYSVVHAQATKCAVEEILENHGMLSREECLKLQFDSQLLVLSTWNDEDEYGVFPGKFLEYMLINKPIISITNGDLPYSEVTQVMREGNFGIAYEASCDQVDYVSLKEYIDKCYKEWMQNGNISHIPVKEVMERYDYRNIIQRIGDLIYE